MIGRALGAAVLVALVGLSSRVAIAQPDPRFGCYRADRPLGTAASAEGVSGPIGERIGEAGLGLQAQATFQLLEGGRVERPATVLRRLWATDSRWVAARETLKVRLSTMTAGWSLTLVPEVSGSDTIYVGEARYMTDVIVASGDWRPPRVAVRVRREPCAPPPNEGS